MLDGILKQDREYDENLVMIVDDSMINRMVLVSTVEKLGLQTVEAESGEQALEQFEQYRPGMVITDVRMPGMDGLELTRHLKVMTGEYFLPVIIVSATDEGNIISDSIDVGGDAYLKRPFPAVVLASQVKALKRFSALHRQLRHHNQVRQHEDEIAEQLFSRAVDVGNAEDDGFCFLKRSAETFSGDLVVSARRPNGDLNVLLGDITGHGLTTTIGALPVSETFRAMTKKGYELEEIVAQINRKLLKLLPTGMFVATAVLSLSAQARFVRIWNGGLPDILIQRGERLTAIGSSHPPLGILRRIDQLDIKTEPLDSNTRLLLFSDGLIEASNAHGELFGEERVKELVGRCAQRCCRLVDQIDAELTQFMEDTAFQDDVTVVEIDGERLQRPMAAPAKSVLAAPQIEESAIDHWNWSVELQGRSLARVDPVAQAMHQLYEYEGNDEHWQVVFTVLTELYVNALDHGVLELDSSLKSSAEGFAQYYETREQRLTDLCGGTVNIELQHTRFSNGGRLIIKVTDSGRGFDYDAWQVKSASAAGLSGRGIHLIREVCDGLTYSEGGCCAEATYRYAL
ncbi:MAG: hypothetical protein CMI01_00700 [Oceanospirillaceae bacterium]|nr:hypothetical protein [Oceanospirillaceae bacterium]